MLIRWAIHTTADAEDAVAVAVAAGWPRSLLKAVGLEELLAKWPQQVVAPGQVVGGLTAEAAAHLGLQEGTPLAQGGADAFIGMLGLGVLRPGQLALLTGGWRVSAQAGERAGVQGGFMGGRVDG